jgi:hypothetical protein
MWRLPCSATVPAAAGLHPGGVDEDGAEQVEDPTEVLDGRGADEDEHRAEHQGEGDAEQQHLLLSHPRDAEAGHDQHEDEEVVDREALLGDVAGEVLTAVLGAGEQQDQQAEDDCDPHVDGGPGGGLAQRGGVRGADVAEEVEDEHGDDRGDGDRPDPERHVHVGVPPV